MNEFTMEPVQPQQRWFKRNMLWFLPLCIVLGMMVCGGMCTLPILGVFGMLKNSTPYQDSLAAAQTSPEVIAELGEPIDSNFFVTGNINLNNDDGVADISYTINGPNGEATVYVDATKTNGQWSYNVMNVQFDGGKRIDLLGEARGSSDEIEEIEAIE